MTIYIIRNNQQYGPYDENTLLQYVNNGQVLKQDRAVEIGSNKEHTVSFFLKKAKLKPYVVSKGNIVSQLQTIGSVV